MAALTGSLSGEVVAGRVEVRRIGVEDIRAALREGWEDFQALRGDILFLGLIYPLVGLIASAAILRNELAPLVFPVAAGLSLLGPAVASGFYELARRRERGEEAGWRHFFDVLRNPSFPWLLVLTAILAVLFLGWVGAAWGIYQATLGAVPPVSVGDFFTRLFTTPDGWALIVFGNLAGLGFAVVSLLVGAVSFPLLVDRPVGLLVAIETSVKAVARNPTTMALWGLTVAVLLALGSLPLFVGLAIVLPLLGYSTWRLYRRLMPPV